MKKHHEGLSRLLFFACLLSTTSANAALLARLEGQAVYDTDRNITWLTNANLAASNTFGISSINPNGVMDWLTANEWIGAMNTANYLGYSDWRLPTTPQPDATCGSQFTHAWGSFGMQGSGYNCTGSEMGHLYSNELGGGSAGSDIAITHNANYNLFNNFQSAYYWSTEYTPLPGFAWIYDFGHGGQDTLTKQHGLYALVVRTGDVAPVPLPAGFWFFCSGLFGLIGLATRSNRRGI